MINPSREGGILSVDLGTTNIKVVLYNADFSVNIKTSRKVVYMTKDKRVEFSPEVYWSTVAETIRDAVSHADLSHQAVHPAQSYRRPSIESIALTGQAESLVFLDRKGAVIGNGISWMDARSGKECQVLAHDFPAETIYEITGLPEIVSTWPAVKLLWLKKNDPVFLSRIGKILLLKDFIGYKLTGVIRGDYSTQSFTCYFDTRRHTYWPEMLERLGVSITSLPEPAPAAIDLGYLLPEAAEETGLTAGIRVNSGGLDHGMAMIGSGSIKFGDVSESTGTVIALASLSDRIIRSSTRIPCHCGVLKDTYILLPVIESGGISLEWFYEKILGLSNMASLDNLVEHALSHEPEIIFLPYLTGVNSPKLDPEMKGVFYGLRIHHTREDMLASVLTGITFLIKKNLLLLEKEGLRGQIITSQGGGAKSEVWNQLKADITGRPIRVPENEDTANMGAALLSIYKSSDLKNLEDTITHLQKHVRIYEPSATERFEKAYQLFEEVEERLSPVFHMC